MLDSFWELLWYTLIIFAFVAYLILLFHVIADLFRDRSMSGIVKTLWIIFLIVLPYISVFIYIIARGRGMAERTMQAQAEAKEATDRYIKQVAGKSAADQIADAKAMLDAGTITQAEFDTLKAKALS
ncbi:SHOCT domain-containing protein [Nocardia cyriacigeorgica]|uniref:SHOCT domain-containing protein n=1 Tax=Nocardia cyriacigeorgica TaxID=135487 RepID=A0A6P1DFH2_9NOCA|nr:SHOCT domain-containing protein [Nocardia cyriacigeorgica]NEW39849.1 SHOCT domain-containing protein [Nocardia cyriacigeorgica]NEW47172.1 SHOCT domain-containing protein [Nocardia cyriacigeorgica]NEW51334.1 SHOCT domain-containing protein [Nocardia cyriacigeorgica]NEW55447.1 SHOCT domain-containing protein [Nocardia cyriacigeorgica]